MVKLAKSTGFFKIGDKVLADWIADVRRKGIIIGITFDNKYFVKIGKITKKFSEDELNFTSSKVYTNPRLKRHHKVYIIRTKTGIPLGAYGGQELAHRHAQRWADRTGEQIVMEVMGIPKK